MTEKTELSELGEFPLIEALIAASRLELPRGVIGPGDDCAVLPHLGQGETGPWYVLTTDALVAGRHFDTNFSSFYDVGWKSLAVNLSDIAAMGGRALGVLVALHLPEQLSVEDCKEIYRGLGDLAKQTGCALLGGDTVGSNELALSLTVIGLCLSKPILRSGASLGDDLWVSGDIGSAAAGLRILKGGTAAGDLAKPFLAKHRRPEPRLSLAEALGRSGLASAMIDISDGLLQDAGHLSERSEVSLEVWTHRVPLHARLLSSGISLNEALSGGDDYELLFTSPARRREELELLVGELSEENASLNVRQIGRVIEGRGEVFLRDKDDTRTDLKSFLAEGLAGFQHFSRRG